MTVAREVFEEVGVRVRDVTYLGDQPWPFPASLMLGFEARTDDATLVQTRPRSPRPRGSPAPTIAAPSTKAPGAAAPRSRSHAASSSTGWRAADCHRTVEPPDVGGGGLRRGAS